MSSILVSAPATEPISLADAKEHLNVDFDDDDTLITAFLKAARQNAEQFTGRAFVDQTWDIFLDEFPTGDYLDIDLRPAPVIEVVSVAYGESYGTTFASSGYIVDQAKWRLGLVVGGAWPTVTKVANAVRVRIRAGYIDNDMSPPSGELPYDIRAAILLTLGTLYANRETIVIGQTATMLPFAAEQLLRPHRIHTGMA
jgi:uncharacterized phiE125 gp8 family phage protein